MIKHIQCDIFESGADLILHQVNCQGVMGSGLAKQVKERYPSVYEDYKEYCDAYKHNPSLLLGRSVLSITWKNYNTDFRGIVNLFAQERFGRSGECYTDYNALRQCLAYINEMLNWYDHSTIAIPYRLGCCRGGGDWSVVYKIIEDIFADSNCDVLICEYDGG